MILTVTLNPAIDISYPLANLALNTTNRVEEESKSAGGKGLNVSRVIHQLGEEVLATGILGGAIGTFIENKLAAEEIPYQFYQTEKESRICIAILHDEGQQTEILESGATYDESYEQGFIAHFTKILTEQPISVVTISGSLPKGLSPSLYAHLIELARRQGVKTILDSSGEALKQSLQGEIKPDVIKPNKAELQGLLGENTLLETESQLIAALEDEIFQGVPWIVVSLGAAGALVKVATDYYRVSVPKITAVSPVGSGDATVAGLATSLARSQSVVDCLKTAMTTGLLNTLEKRTGFINPDNFLSYFNQIIVKKLN